MPTQNTMNSVLCLRTLVGSNYLNKYYFQEKKVGILNCQHRDS